MKSKKETFAETMQTFSYRYDLRTAFDDFLTICLCTFSQNFKTGKSHDEDLYMATIARYSTDEVRDTFPKMLAALIVEMEERVHDGAGNDVLGDFYETNLYRKGASQYFTPYPVCVFMSHCLKGEANGSENVGFRRILDPSCGSGRMLLAGANTFGRNNYFYGIDLDHTCVKMTVLNLFLNGIFEAEVMCADALSPNDFRMSYAISFMPIGIIRIADREKSRLWHMHVNAFKKKEAQAAKEVKWLPEDGKPVGNGSQLQLF